MCIHGASVAASANKWYPDFSVIGYSDGMDTVWLAITVLSLGAGSALLATLVLLRRFSGHTPPPLELLVGAMVLIGFAAFLGVYLRILGIPRSTIPFRLVNSAAWGYAVAACLVFISHWQAFKVHPGGKRPRRRITVLTAVAAGAATGGAAFAVVHAPWPPEWYVIQGLIIAGLEALVGGIAIWAAIVALRHRRDISSPPWRIAQHGTAIALCVLVPASLLEFAAALVVRLQGRAMPDGFIFSAGYGIACAIIAVALVRGLGVGPARGGAGAGNLSSVPQGMVSVVGITPRERDIMEQVLQGYSDRQIAAILFISPRTVDTHLRNIFRKCDVSSRLQLAQRVAEFRTATQG